MVVTIILIIIIITCLYLLLYTNNIPKNYPPGPKPFPIWGGYYQILIENFKFPYKAIHNMSKRYKTNVVGTYFGSFPTVIACDMETIREVLTRPEFQGRVDGFIARYRSYGERLGIIFTDGHQWEEQRRFMLRNMRDFGYGKRSDSLEGKYLEDIQDLINILHKNDHPFTKDGLVQIPEVLYATMANMCIQVFGSDRKPLKEAHNFSEKIIKMARVLDTTGAINITPWMRYLAPGPIGFTIIKNVNQFLQNFVQDLITEHTDKMTDNTADDFIDRYICEMRKRMRLETETTFTIKQLQLIGVDMLFTGISTLSFILGFIILLLAKHRDVQQKFQKEIDDIVGRNRLPTLTDRSKMPYTEAIIRESMRYQTLLPLGVPHKALQDTTLGGYFIPKGTMVMTSLYSIHRDENIWNKPDEFIPERFIDSEGKLIKHDPSLPFGIGKRVCPGETFARQNIFMIISGLVQNFDFNLSDSIPLPDLNENISAINESPKPFHVKVTPR